MTETNGAAETPATPAVSRIVIEFPGGPGTSNMRLRHEGIASAQAYAAAFYLDKWAMGLFAFEQEQVAKQLATAVPADVQAVVDQIMKGNR